MCFVDHGQLMLPTMNTRTQKTNPTSKIDLKEACVVAAQEVIAERGVENLSLREVSRKLGVSHQAPYKHYPSRDHLLAEPVYRSCNITSEGETMMHEIKLDEASGKKDSEMSFKISRLGGTILLTRFVV